MLTPEELLEALLRPDSPERWSVLTGEPVLAVQFGAGDTPVDPARLRRAQDRLMELACVTVAICEEAPPRTTSSVVDHFDLVVTSPAKLARIAAVVRDAPLACLALVQLLRLGEDLDIHQGLLAESWVYSTLQGGPEFARWLEARAAPRPGPSAAGPPLRIERDAGQLRIVLQRPERRNAFSCAMRDALCEALGLVAADGSIERVELRGEGPDFCSGGDLAEFGTLPDPATAAAVRATRSPARLLAASAERVHAYVHGSCIGAGVELAAFCGHVTARADACFQLPEVGMGLVPGAGGTVSLPRRIGRQRAAWLALTGEGIDAETARRWRLIDAIEPEP